MSMNALKRLDGKQFIVFIGTLALSLVSFFTLLPESKALPDTNADSKLNNTPVFPNADIMAPATSATGSRALPRLLKVRPECTNSTPATGGQNHTA